jgi:Arc/MetJ-type ribon-helix-helix transcriptional regulator
MVKSISVHQKKRGRPATGRDPAITVRLPVALVSAIDRWGAKNSFSRSEAIRRLLEEAPAISDGNKSAKEAIPPAAKRDRELERQKIKNRSLKAKLRKMVLDAGA